MLKKYRLLDMPSNAKQVADPGEPKSMITEQHMCYNCKCMLCGHFFLQQSAALSAIPLPRTNECGCDFGSLLCCRSCRSVVHWACVVGSSLEGRVCPSCGFTGHTDRIIAPVSDGKEGGKRSTQQLYYRTSGQLVTMNNSQNDDSDVFRQYFNVDPRCPTDLIDSRLASASVMFTNAYNNHLVALNDADTASVSAQQLRHFLKRARIEEDSVFDSFALSEEVYGFCEHNVSAERLLRPKNRHRPLAEAARANSEEQGSVKFYIPDDPIGNSKADQHFLRNVFVQAKKHGEKGTSSKVQSSKGVSAQNSLPMTNNPALPVRNQSTSPVVPLTAPTTPAHSLVSRGTTNAMALRAAQMAANRAKLKKMTGIK